MGDSKQKGSMRRFLLPGALGFGLAYFLDPDRGARRRNIARDRLMAMLRRLGSRSQKLARFAEGHAYGVVQETVPHRRDNPNPDDLTLRDRVESEVFRDPNIPKGDINIDVVEGIVELRGELKQPEDINNLVKTVQKVRDVKSVHSYLHLPGTPAPNKAEVLQVS